jgi:hypothetical protein
LQSTFAKFDPFFYSHFKDQCLDDLKEPRRSQACTACLAHLQIVPFPHIRVAADIYTAFSAISHIYTGLAVAKSLI